MKHFMAIHRFHNDEARKAYCSAQGEPGTQKDWIAFGNTTHDHVKCRQEWVGDDLAFCHWEAESAEAVHAWLDELGVGELISTELFEQWRFTSFYNPTDDLRQYKEF